MTAKSFLFFLAIFVAVSIGADLYYYNRVAQKDDPTQISCSDFKVFWFAAWNLKHHVPRVKEKFRHFWFLNPELKSEAIAQARFGGCDLYDKNQAFYHFRYSPFIAFILMPFGWMMHQGHALAIWYFILNVSFLFALLILAHNIKADFGLKDLEKMAILWVIFLGTLRFYLVNISNGQSDILIALCLVLFLIAYVRDKDMLGGFFFAIILHFKILFLPAILYFLLRGKIKLILSIIVSFLILSVMPAYALGLSKTISLFRAWMDILSYSIPSQVLNIKNQSLVYAISSISPLPRKEKIIYLAGIILMVLSFLAIACLAGLSQKARRVPSKYLEIGLLIIAILVFSPISWTAHFISLIIPLGIAASFYFTDGRKTFISAALIIYFVLSCLIGTDITDAISGMNNARFANIAIGAILLGICLYASHISRRID